MDKHYHFKEAEEKLYQLWEERGYFTAKRDPQKKPFTIVLPPPNASGKMHTGNVLMVAIEDLLIRWHRMRGYSTLWIPGTDHAGTETQITFERELKKQGKSRFQYTRKQLYDEIWQFVQNNKGQIENQIRQMGASVDWSRYRFTLDPQVVKTVHNTFKKMHGDGLVYRSEYMVNYCPKCGTTYADVELKHEEKNDPLYYINYKFKDNNDHITVATVRPETVVFDTHLAVNPKGAHADLVAQDRRVINPLSGQEMRFLTDNFVDPEFGTGIVKLTPAIDKNDYEVFQRHHNADDPSSIQLIEVLHWDGSGKMRDNSPYAGLSVHQARKKAIEALESKEVVSKVDEKYMHNVALCKAGHQIEPMIIPNWFIKTDDPKISLKKPALDAVKEGKVNIYPKWREITYIRWMEEMRDWPVSRQNVWGIQIPVWYEVGDPNEFYVWYINKEGVYSHGILGTLLDKGVTLEEVSTGLQRLVARPSVTWVFEEDKDPNKQYLPETDTFDTWFSSGQWPLVALGYPDSEDFDYFYPTAVLETGWEIIRLWVSRMIMFGIYLDKENRPPFSDVYLHGIVKALDGRKMSKSLGNVINPEEYSAQYGVDALRMGLISGTANGKDFAFPKDRVIAYKHFANKIWNMGRFILMMHEQYGKEVPAYETLSTKQLKEDDEKVLKALQAVITEVDASLIKYRFADAGEAIYQFLWHEIADIYIEQVKQRKDQDVALAVLTYVFVTSLKLLHPFMPFVTEEIYQKMPGHGESIMIESWPTA